MNLRNRIVELRQVKASELQANEKNWRLHPEGQRAALDGMIQDIGFVGAVIARQVNGHLELLDGHLRADLAGDEEVPVLITDLNDQEASKLLATYDPLSTMALVDNDALAALLKDVQLDEHAELRKLLADLHEEMAEQEDKDGGKDEREVAGMALAPHEHYDYLVVLATTTQEWNVLCDRLGLVPAARRGRMGTCRAIRASKLLDLLPPRNA